MAMPPYTRTQQIIDEQRQAQNLARAIRQGTRPSTDRVAPDLAESTEQLVHNLRRFNEQTRNRALLLAASKRLRRVYLLGATLALFVLSPLLVFVAGLIGRYFDGSWWLFVPLILGLIVVPLYALRAYFIWVRSHWYRWIGEGIKEDYEEGELL
jgi:hypothetical protein